jgi:hemerythrin
MADDINDNLAYELKAVMGETEPTHTTVPVQWKKEMSVGVDIIDADHKAFFDLVNLIQTCSFDENNVALKENILIIESCLGILAEYVAGHFYREEKAMRMVNFPYTSEHKHKHEMFKGKAHEFIKAYGDGFYDILKDLPELVNKWLTGHIMVEDKRYEKWISNKSIDDRPLVYLTIESEEYHEKMKSIAKYKRTISKGEIR